MVELIKTIGWLILGCFGFAVVFVFLWFVIGMLICFYKINIKKSKPKSTEFDNYLN